MFMYMYRYINQRVRVSQCRLGMMIFLACLRTFFHLDLPVDENFGIYTISHILRRPYIFFRIFSTHYLRSDSRFSDKNRVRVSMRSSVNPCIYLRRSPTRINFFLFKCFQRDALLIKKEVVSAGKNIEIAR